MLPLTALVDQPFPVQQIACLSPATRWKRYRQMDACGIDTFRYPRQTPVLSCFIRQHDSAHRVAQKPENQHYSSKVTGMPFRLMTSIAGRPSIGAGGLSNR
jgi:hypothetical protein